MIDTHCHIDQYSDPMHLANESDRLNIITIGMTNLPSHFEIGYKHLLSHKKVRLALGMHPLYANLHKNELPIFLRNLKKTSYIGEIGLDFSKEGNATRQIQLSSFNRILKELKGKKKIISLHSRRAEKEVLELLIENKIQNAIFHWYSGPVKLIDEIVRNGYYFSINPAMIYSKSGQDAIQKIPLENLLTESDGPFIQVENRQIRPSDISLVINYLSSKNNLTPKFIEEKIYQNFKKLIDNIS